MQAGSRIRPSSSDRVTSARLERPVIQQQGEDQARQLASSEDESTAVMITHRFTRFTLIKGAIVGQLEAYRVGGFDQIVAEITDAAFATRRTNLVHLRA
jgi:hypothetical protein